MDRDLSQPGYVVVVGSKIASYFYSTRVIP